MPIPIICLDEQVRQFAQRFRHELSKPQYQYLVIVLLGLMLCEGTRTLQGLLRQIADGPSLAGLSRFHVSQIEQSVRGRSEKVSAIEKPLVTQRQRTVCLKKKSRAATDNRGLRQRLRANNGRRILR